MKEKYRLIDSLTKCGILGEWDFNQNPANINDHKTCDHVWWKCPHGHKWKAKISNRISSLKRGCPYCSGSLPTAENNLLIRRPDVLRFWNYSKNAIRPDEILPSSTKSVWWKCLQGHEWQASPHQITNKKSKSGCPYCKGLMPSKDNNIMDRANLLREWDYESNCLLPENMTCGKGIKAHWKCEFGHKWQASIASRTRVRGSNCPFCKRKHSDVEIRIYCEIKSLFPDTVWHHKHCNKEIDVFIPCLNIGIEIDGSKWHNGKEDKDKSKTAHYAANGIKVIRLREQPLSKLLSDDILYKTQEDQLNIVTRLFEQLYIITKNELFSEYVKNGNILNIKEYNKYRHSVLGFSKSLAETHPHLVSEWDEMNNAITPHNMSYGSGRKVWWKCENCCKKWESTIKSRTAGGGCPYCSGKIATEENNLLIIFPEIKKIWDYDANKLPPETYLPYSHSIVWFRQADGTSKKGRISDRTKSMDKNTFNLP